MESVTASDLRIHSGEVLRRVEQGESLVVTRAGVEVAEIRPVHRRQLSTAELIARRRSLPAIDVDKFRSDVDSLIDPSL